MDKIKNSNNNLLIINSNENSISRHPQKYNTFPRLKNKRDIHVGVKSNKRRGIIPSEDNLFDPTSHNNKQEKPKSIQVRHVQSFTPKKKVSLISNSFACLPSPYILGCEYKSDENPEDLFLTLEEKVIKEKTVNLPSFLRKSTPEQINKLKKTVELMKADLELRNINKSPIQSPVSNLEIKEIKPAKVFAKSIIDQLKLLEKKQESEKTNLFDLIVQKLIEEPILSNYISTVPDKKEGIVRKVKNVIKRSFKSKESPLLIKNYPKGEYGLYLKVVDIYELVINDYNVWFQEKNAK